MPWTVKDVDKHKKGLTPEEKKSWVSIANSVLKSCKAKGGSDCDGKAIRIANSKATGTKSEIDGYITALSIVHFASNVKIKSIKDIETQSTDEGLLIKGVPVFKAGTYRDTEYSTDYIDRNFISHFKVEDDIPFQADHNPSIYATLGWVKALTRKAQILYADFLIVDDNAIARWKKGLLKKFSLGVDILRDRIREISATPFPYIKAARVHSDDTLEEEINIEATEVNGSYFVTIEGEQYEAKKDDDGLWMFFPISRRGADGELQQEEWITVSDEDIDNIDLKEDIADDDDTDYGEDEEGEPFTQEDFAKLSTKYKNSLPDSSFLLVKKPVRDKSGDRVLPIKNKDGKISRLHVQNALAGVAKIKGFSVEYTNKAKSRLLRMSKKLGVELESKHSEVFTMKLEDLKRIDLSKVEGAELIKEAIEHITTLETERDEANTKLTEIKEQNKDLSQKIKEAKVSEKVAELKQAGKITPAQEDSISKFMLTLSDEAIDEFVKVISSGKKQVDLGEAGAGGDGEPKDKLDIDNMEAADINKVAEKLAEEHKVEFEEALDWCYDSKVGKDGKLLKKE